MKTKIALSVAYGLFVMTVVCLSFYGRSYYLAPLAVKARLPLHSVLRQSGTLGHLFGIIGTLFLILLMVYSLRKRLRFMRGWGNLNTWLEVHILLGLSGPALVLFHTGFKFAGIVGISAWSMILVVASGIVGRYFYRLIPRSLSGMELNRIELEAEEIKLTFEIRKLLLPGNPFWKILARLDQSGSGVLKPGSPLAFRESARSKNRLRKALKEARLLSPKQRRNLLKLIVTRQNLVRRKQFMEKAMKILHYWHVLHIPFVIILFLVLLVHVYVTVAMGYRWIF